MLIALRPFRFGFVSNLKYMALGIALILATVGVVSSLGLSPELYSQVLLACIAVEVVAVIVLGAWTGRTVWSLRLEPQGVALVTRDGAVVDAAGWSELRWAPGRYFLVAGVFSRNVPVLTLTFPSGRLVTLCHVGVGVSDSQYPPAIGRPGFYVIPDELDHLGRALQTYSPMDTSSVAA
ncbi:MAG: hypothetical protein IPN17_05210 [Deltaproteobacteria bacterium]|nr:hypothetical protein [Deltaproteobacteria bacterium]